MRKVPPFQGMRIVLAYPTVGCEGVSGQATVQMGRHESITRSWECHTSLAVDPRTTKKPGAGPLHIHLLNYTG